MPGMQTPQPVNPTGSVEQPGTWLARVAVLLDTDLTLARPAVCLTLPAPSRVELTGPLVVVAVVRIVGTVGIRMNVHMV